MTIIDGDTIEEDIEIIEETHIEIIITIIIIIEIEDINILFQKIKK